MTESEAREVLVVQAHDAAPGALWTAEDAVWASRLADESVSDDAPAERWAVARARHALQRLQPRVPAIAAWLRLPMWRERWLAVPVVLGVLAGAFTDAVAHGQQVQVLPIHLWAVVLWSLAVYAILLLNALRIGPAFSGHFRQLISRLLQTTRTEGPLAAAALRWAAISKDLMGARAAVLLHMAAAAVGLGMLASLYWRGLALDYRAAWESTFVEAEFLHALLTVILSPAMTITQIELPDVGGLAAMRLTPQHPHPTASAAPWIHLHAATLLVFVVLPRTALAIIAWARARWLSGHIVLIPGDRSLGAWRLDAGRKGGRPTTVHVLPYAQSPEVHTALGLRQLLGQVFAESLVMKMADITRVGEEESVAARAGPPDTHIRIALADLTATPEAEHHGRWCRALSQLSPAVPWILLLDEAAFRARFGALPGRLADRRTAWKNFAREHAVPMAIVNLDQPERPDNLEAVRRVIGS
jgi:hypothetical protein